MLQRSRHQVCNWLVPGDDANPACVSCRLNDMIPDLTVGNNRGMGLPDLYPFVLSAPAIQKLHFVHEVLTASIRK